MKNTMKKRWMVLSELIREFDLVFGGAMQGLKDTWGNDFWTEMIIGNYVIEGGCEKIPGSRNYI